VSSSSSSRHGTTRQVRKLLKRASTSICYANRLLCTPYSSVVVKPKSPS
jgi:hypothetical protein